MQRLPPDGFSAEFLGIILAQDQDFAKFYAYYQKRIKSYLVNRWVHNHDIAEDLWQETITSFWVYIAREGITDDYKSLLYRVADSRAIDYLRNKAQKIKSQSLSEIEEYNLIDNQKIGSSRLRDALAQLPLKEREILMAVYDQGIKKKDIAVKYGISKSRVSQIVNSAKEKLRPTIYSVPIDIQLRESEMRYLDIRAWERLANKKYVEGRKCVVPPMIDVVTREIIPAVELDAPYGPKINLNQLQLHFNISKNQHRRVKQEMIKFIYK
jgi:RNA polymerase sigma factor (sigma-70 family)